MSLRTLILAFLVPLAMSSQAFGKWKSVDAAQKPMLYKTHQSAVDDAPRVLTIKAPQGHYQHKVHYRKYPVPTERRLKTGSQKPVESKPNTIESTAHPVKSVYSLLPGYQPTVNSASAIFKTNGVVQRETNPINLNEFNSTEQNLRSKEESYVHSNLVDDEYQLQRQIKRTTVNPLNYQQQQQQQLQNFATTLKTSVEYIEKHKFMSELTAKKSDASKPISSATVASLTASAQRQTTPVIAPTAAVPALPTVTVSKPVSDSEAHNHQQFSAPTVYTKKVVLPELKKPSLSAPSMTFSHFSVNPFSTEHLSTSNRQSSAPSAIPLPASSVPQQPSSTVTLIEQISTDSILLPLNMTNSNTISGSNTIGTKNNVLVAHSGATVLNTNALPTNVVTAAGASGQKPGTTSAHHQDDTLGCAWDIVTNSCKDLFNLGWCEQCYDFGNIFLHNCKCLVKTQTQNPTTFV